MLPAGQRDVVGADVLGDATRLPGDDIRFADVIEERGLAVIDVTHDSHHRWPRLQLFLGVFNCSGRIQIRGVLFLLHCLEAEFAGDQLDLVEIESLVDGDHQTEILEREAHDLYSRRLENLSELANGDELVHAYRFLLALCLGLPLRSKLFAVGAVLGATRASATDRPAH